MMLRLLFLLFFFSLSSLIATPSALFWTFVTTDIVDPCLGVFEVSNLFKPINDRFPTIPDAMVPTDIGFNIGLPWCGPLKAEAGVDYFAGARDPLFFNAKVGVDQNKLFPNAPAVSFGILYVGTTRTTDFNVWDLNFGKSLPCPIGGTVFVGGYLGNPSIGKDRGGFWAGYDHPFYKKKDCKGKDFYRWRFTADFATGDNLIGGGGVGVIYALNSYSYFQAGPTWFVSNRIYGSWKVALYFTVAFPVWRCKK